jgi:DNA-binding MarR family transcriptional regulator
LPRKGKVKAGDAALSAVQFEAWGGFLATHSRLSALLDASLRREHGLTLAEYDVLINLHWSPGRRLRMAALAGAVHFSLGGMSKLVRRLETQGLVRREPDPDDGRAWFAALTPAGEQVLTAARGTHLADVRRLFLDHVDADELDVLARVWRRVLAGVEQVPGGAQEESGPDGA